ncbi:alpha/beta fold hydrolase [Kitasatospora arboriphila]
MVERTVGGDGVELCTESFGDPADPPVLLVMGIGASMLWWEEGFCRLLAGGRRFVIRYDHRDTGRSTTYPPGRPGYTGADLVADAARVLDGHGIPAAHVVGVSAGGALAQLLALDDPGRVLSLVLISTSSAVPGDRALPAPAEELMAFLAAAGPGPSDADALVGHLVAYARLLSGGGVRSTRPPSGTWPAARSGGPVTSPPPATTTRCRRAAPPGHRSPRSPCPCWWSTGRPTRCSRSRTARTSRSGSPVRGS